MENIICSGCGKEIEPQTDDYEIIDHDHYRTGYDGVRDWIQETIVIECAECKAHTTISDGWIVDPRIEDD